MKSCSKFLRYVYEMPNVFIGRISQAEPGRSLLRVVLCEYIFKVQNATEFNTLDKLLSEDLGHSIPFLAIQAIRSRFQQSKLFLQSLWEMCIIQNAERCRASPFLKG